ncbi:phosphoglucosamine mutase [Allofustis seminis]|uniref:phosphoglucosamine mutase n=1 Tax=Allofustis seminis TaxID=166939 RepID=UPI00035DB03D|nr:phosphoglucosamine mutase [Allofustis seminis]
MQIKFGTDGVRGVANQELTPEIAFKLGRFGGYVLAQHIEEDHAKVLVGKDTRASGTMLEFALIAGLLSVGAEVLRLGVISTPGVSYLTRQQNATAGIMISASHNPAQDNGIKFFGADGFKLSDEQEREIEALIYENEDVDSLPRPSAEGLGNVEQYLESVLKYNQFLMQTIPGDLSGLHIVLDGANGATGPMLNRLFADLETDFTVIGNQPNGLNINDGVGSTHPEALAKKVVEEGADAGLAFDGDGDRLIAVDEKGNIIDGDKIMFICGKYLNEKGRLKNNTIVSTVMSNLGFYKALDSEKIASVVTTVGDRYVVEAMREGGHSLGGEQSGHIIFLDHHTTGDGLLTAIQLLYIIKDTGKTLGELAEEVHVYPQKLVNIIVHDKDQIMEDEDVQAAIAEVENKMNGNGRVLVRPSGTEPLLRVMVEAPTDELVDEYCHPIVELIREKFGKEE